MTTSERDEAIRRLKWWLREEHRLKHIWTTEEGVAECKADIKSYRHAIEALQAYKCESRSERAAKKSEAEVKKANTKP